MNNLLRSETPPAERVEWLVQWTKAAWPGVKVAVMALTPHNWEQAEQVGPTNALLQEAAKRQGAAFIQCGQTWRPADKTLFTDGLHFTAAGNKQLVACLRAGVKPLLGK